MALLPYSVRQVTQRSRGGRGRGRDRADLSAPMPTPDAPPPVVGEGEELDAGLLENRALENGALETAPCENGARNPPTAQSEDAEAASPAADSASGVASKVPGA